MGKHLLFLHARINLYVYIIVLYGNFRLFDIHPFTFTPVMYDHAHASKGY